VLVFATAIRYCVVICLGLVVGARHIVLHRPLLPDVYVRRDFRRYAVRMQTSALTTFADDGLIIAALLPVRFVGIYTLGYQAAAALRSLPLYAFPPILTRLTGAFAKRGLSGAVEEFQLLEQHWQPTVLGYGCVATAAIGFGVRAWLGNSFGLSAIVATVLMGGFTIQVTLTGMRTCFVRAVGRPGLETKYSILALLLNVALTVPFTILFGLVGEVTATSVGIVCGTIYYVVLCRRAVDLPYQWPEEGAALVIGLAVLMTVLGELLIAQLDVHGFLGLALAGLPSLPGLALIASQITRASIHGQKG
jgi:O-antigen/teichoic acid export membrane protein